MTLAPGIWLMAPDGTLIRLWRTHGSGERFADHSDKIERVIHPADDEYDRRLNLEFSGDEGPGDWRLIPSGEETPDGYKHMCILPPPGVFY